MSTVTFSRVLVANRGEIALRILRCLREMGIPSALLCSAPDRESLPARLADEVVVRDDPRVYLDVAAVVAAARECGADAVHPGYGFLSENPELARRVEEAGISFIGPSPGVLAHLGAKDRARRTALSLGVPVVPGSPEPVATWEEAAGCAGSIGYPVILKAAAGGGGRGMRRVETPEAMAAAFERASSEAARSFSDGSLYVEKWMEPVRHVEIQFAADRFGRAVYLGERDCSTQRRHQKLVEESPSPAVDRAMRERMGEAALRLVRHAGYVGVGTAEFLVGEEGRFHFIEVNARLQVEHPVTEMVTGVDLVRLQVLLAAGEPLPIGQEDVRLQGHAIEFRINAEEPARGFLPAPGMITALLPPGGPGVRVDSAAFPSWEVSPLYDSLIAKLIVWAPDRAGAVRRAARALDEFQVEGVPTTLSFHRWLVRSAAFREGRVTTTMVEREYRPAPVPPRRGEGASPQPSGGGGGTRQPPGPEIPLVEMASGARVDGVPRQVQAAVVGALQAYLAPGTTAGGDGGAWGGRPRRWRVTGIHRLDAGRGAGVRRIGAVHDHLRDAGWMEALRAARRHGTRIPWPPGGHPTGDAFGGLRS